MALTSGLTKDVKAKDTMIRKKKHKLADREALPVPQPNFSHSRAAIKASATICGGVGELDFLGVWRYGSAGNLLLRTEQRLHIWLNAS